jgi:hypothetical protein
MKAWLYTILGLILIAVLMFWSSGRPLSSLLPESDQCRTIDVTPYMFTEKDFDEHSRYERARDYEAISAMGAQRRIGVFAKGRHVFKEDSARVGDGIKIRAEGTTTSVWTRKEYVKCDSLFILKKW